MCPFPCRKIADWHAANRIAIKRYDSPLKRAASISPRRGSRQILQTMGICHSSFLVGSAADATPSLAQFITGAVVGLSLLEAGGQPSGEFFPMPIIQTRH